MCGPDSKKLHKNKCVLFYIAKFVVICNAARLVPQQGTGQRVTGGGGPC